MLRELGVLCAVLGVAMAVGCGEAPPDFNADYDAMEARGVGRDAIVGGTVAEIGAWPWAVALVRQGEDPDHNVFCGGSLIAFNLVLTAAHCVSWLEPDEISVIVGRRNIGIPEQGERSRIVEYTIHPDYQDNPVPRHDVAVIQTTTWFTNQTIEVAGADVLWPGDELVAIGWGDVHEGTWSNEAEAVNKLRQVEIPSLANAQCNSPGVYSGLVQDDMLCAGSLEGGKGTCFGDSGGPLMRYAGGKYTVVGTTSWGGYQCSVANKPNVFARLASHTDFIENFVTPVTPPLSGNKTAMVIAALSLI